MESFRSKVDNYNVIQIKMVFSLLFVINVCYSLLAFHLHSHQIRYKNTRNNIKH